MVIQFLWVKAGLTHGDVQPQAVETEGLEKLPVESVMWQSMADRFMPDGEIVFDNKVIVMAPFSAENQFHVPITVDATAH